jgi:hypothetical protein
MTREQTHEELSKCLLIGGTLLFILALAGCGSVCELIPGCHPSPQPTPPPPWECPLEMPECHVVEQTCSTPESPCWHNPTGDPEHCERAPDCPLPQPQCETFTDRGGDLQPMHGACDCYVGHEYFPCPEPDVCPYDIPTAAQLQAAGYRVEIRPDREAGKQFGASPFACWPEGYYCDLGQWPEACAEGRRCGPVLPDGHPDKAVCESKFMGQSCAYWTYQSATHMSFDPFIVIHGVNQNHPRNVEVCGQEKFGDDPSWVKVDGFVQAGQWSWATVHGNGMVCAEAKDGVGKRCVQYQEP